MLTLYEKWALERADKLLSQADALVQEAFALQEPIVQRIVATDDVEQMKALVDQLPSGFYRCELRVIISRN